MGNHRECGLQHRIPFCLASEVPEASAPCTDRSNREGNIGGDLPGRRVSIVGDGSYARSYPHLYVRAGHLWNPSNFVGAAGHVSAEMIQKYIESQKVKGHLSYLTLVAKVAAEPAARDVLLHAM